jgi:hypothetical protein
MLNIQQVCFLLNIKRTQVYSLIKRGVFTVLPLIKRNKLIPYEQVMRVAEEAKANVPQAGTRRAGT